MSMLVSPADAATEKQKQAEARKIMFDYAACVVKGHHQRASEAILANATTGVIRKAYPDLIRGDCLVGVAGSGTSLQFRGEIFRFSLAEALIAVDFAASGPTDFSNKLPLASLPIRTQTEFQSQNAKPMRKQKHAELEDDYLKDQAFVWLETFGECIVRANPGAARLWILTKPDRPEETSRINAIRPAFAQCLEGGTFKFDKSMLRGTVATNYYRLAMATPQPTPGKTH